MTNFVWTFDGIMQAIGLGVVAVVIALYLLAKLFLYISDKRRKKK